MTGETQYGEAPSLTLDGRETELTRRRYDRIAPVYDMLEWMMELRVRAWRRELWKLVQGDSVLELGVGTISTLPVLRSLMRWLDPVPVHIWGAHIDRDTVANVRAAGFEDVEGQNRSLDVVKLIFARAPAP